MAHGEKSTWVQIWVVEVAAKANGKSLQRRLVEAKKEGVSAGSCARACWLATREKIHSYSPVKRTLEINDRPKVHRPTKSRTTIFRLSSLAPIISSRTMATSMVGRQGLRDPIEMHSAAYSEEEGDDASPSVSLPTTRNNQSTSGQGMRITTYTVPFSYQAEQS